ncbi:hypothetical protein CMEL01_14916, partial [Colletotrichum melonis]
VPIWLRQRTSPSVIIPFFLLFGHPLRHLGSPPVVVPAYLLSRPINKSASHHQLGVLVDSSGGTQFVLSASLRLQLQAVLFAFIVVWSATYLQLQCVWPLIQHFVGSSTSDDRRSLHRNGDAVSFGLSSPTACLQFPALASRSAKRLCSVTSTFTSNSTLSVQTTTTNHRYHHQRYCSERDIANRTTCFALTPQTRRAAAPH